LSCPAGHIAPRTSKDKLSHLALYVCYVVPLSADDCKRPARVALNFPLPAELLGPTYARPVGINTAKQAAKQAARQGKKQGKKQQGKQQQGKQQQQQPRGFDAHRSWGHLLTTPCGLSCCSQHPQFASRWPTHSFDSSQASLIIAHTAQPLTADPQIESSYLLHLLLYLIHLAVRIRTDPFVGSPIPIFNPPSLPSAILSQAKRGPYLSKIFPRAAESEPCFKYPSPALNIFFFTSRPLLAF
jgi:hypothetical protein